MSIFNLENQNTSLDNKIVAGLERLSQVFRILLWEKAKEHSLSPIQIQLLIFIHYHSAEKSTISYLAQEFNVTKPTISDAIKVLEQKELIQKIVDTNDSRSYTIKLSQTGKQMVTETENFTVPLTNIIGKTNEDDKKILWQNISNTISTLYKMEILSVQRTCSACKHFSKRSNSDFCNLLNVKLEAKDIRLDCIEFEKA